MTFVRHYASSRLPLWYRIALYAIDHDGEQLDRAQLHNAVDPQRLVRSAEITRAIRHGVTKGMLQPGSSTTLLRLVHDEQAA